MCSNEMRVGVELTEWTAVRTFPGGWVRRMGSGAGSGEPEEAAADLLRCTVADLQAQLAGVTRQCAPATLLSPSPSSASPTPGLGV